MDPNAALARIRELMSPPVGMRITAYERGQRTSEMYRLVADLDEWLSKGGFLPSAWLSGRVVINREDLD